MTRLDLPTIIRSMSATATITPIIRSFDAPPLKSISTSVVVTSVGTVKIVLN